MPYAGRADLSPSLQRRLPMHAQDIHYNAFNNAWTSYRRRADRQAVGHRVAWAAVKRPYRRDGDRWVRRTSLG